MTAGIGDTIVLVDGRNEIRTTVVNAVGEYDYRVFTVVDESHKTYKVQEAHTCFDGDDFWTQIWD